jgi:malonyl CoA-acyl carrier protein transacylase/NAD(P)-dependent dehydrogenase (short-subunit alcohol dehydrogenase family)
MLDGIEQVWLANLNSPRQTIIAGEVAAVAQVEARARAHGLVVRRLEAPYAFHTPRLLAAQQSFERTLAGVEMKTAAFDVWSNATAQPYPQELATLRALLARQLISPVRFEALVRDMYRTGARLFLEVGPGEVLSGLVRDTLQELPHTMISCDRPSRGSLRSLLEALAQLATCGIPVDERAAFVDREPRTISLDERPRLPFRADGARVWNAAAPPPPSKPVGPLSAAPAAAKVLDERRKTVREYLELTRTLVETQREVMLAYLQPYPRAAPPEHKPLERADVHSERATIAAVGEVGNAGGSPEETLCALFAERTGYPPEMLQTNSDLEAELGIDSIKRMEVLQRFLERSPLEAGAKERGVAALMQQRSVGAICSELARLGLHEGAALDGTLPRASRDVVACERPSASAPPEQLLRALLAERTGYALEMLDDDADLEGELGIDSIKRTEVLQQFLERQPLDPVERERKLERMLRARTVSAICAALEQAPRPARPGILPDTCAQEARREEAAARTQSLLRLVPQALATSPATARAPQACRVAITGEAREVCEAVVRSLRALGVEASRVAAPEDLGDSFNALVCLSALDRTDLDPAKRAFAWVRAAVRAELHAVLGVTALGGDLGMQPNQAAGAGGISGLLKSFAREHAATRFRILDVAHAESVEDLAGHVCDELFADDELLEVGRRAKARFVSRAIPSERPNAPRVALTSDHVLLLVGGARGITRAVAHGLHARFGCKLVLAGRSDPTFARGAEFDVRDVAAARRAALAQDPHLSARELDRAAHELRAARDCALGLHALESTGARVDYHSLDIRDPAAVRALYAAIEQSHGRLDGVIHAAGLLADGLGREKLPSTFDRVYDTKVKGARNLLAYVPHSVRFFVCFSSVAALYGNRGQTDYAAANDVLDVLARTRPREPALELRSIAWGPWAGTGMVGPELERHYLARGISLIAPELGVAECIDEIMYGDAPHVALLAEPMETAHARL